MTIGEVIGLLAATCGVIWIPFTWIHLTTIKTRKEVLNERSWKIKVEYARKMAYYDGHKQGYIDGYSDCMAGNEPKEKIGRDQ